MAAKNSTTKAKRQAKQAGEKDTAKSTAKSKGDAKQGGAGPKGNNFRNTAEYATFKSLEERQKVVERAKRAVFAALMDMTYGSIDHAKNGNYTAAKFLFDFAGIDDLPPWVEAATEVEQEASGAEGREAVTEQKDPVLSFYKRLGLEPPVFKKEPTSERVPEGAGAVV